jgi:acyl-CoA reductase-like NAD-dependent aldehyde dehydrogenase
VLKEKFDFICFTGGSSLGKIIHKAANEHLTPCLLELGGSNPVIVWKDINIPVTARRLVSTAFMNAGQTCIRPQILFTHQDVLEPFVNEMKKCINNFYQIGNDQSEYRVQAAYNAYLASKPAGTPLSIQDWIRREDNEAKENAEKNQNLDINDPKYVSNFKWIKNSPWLGRIINREAFQRLTNLIEQDRKFIVFGGEYAELNDDTPDTDLIISPTIMVFKDIRDFNNAKSVLNGEIFGPIITILAINDGARSPTANANTSLTAVIDWINSRDKPLSLYCYTFDDNVKKQVLENTSSGSLAFNDSVLQISNSNLPFGGVGMSGMGSYHGKYSLESFSHQKAVLDKGKFNVNYCDLPLRYPPYFTHAQTTMASAAALERFDFGLGNIAIAVPVLAAGAYGLYSVLPALLPVLQSGLDMLKDFYAQGPK